MGNGMLVNGLRLSNEMSLLLMLLRGQWDEPHVMNINWEHFLKLTLHHRVYPTIYTRLRQLDDVQWIPLFVMESLNMAYKRNTFQMLQLGGEMAFVSQALSSLNIRSIFLKGPILAADLYGDVSMRTSCDLDILVGLNDLLKTEHLLVSLGYEKDDYIHSILGDWKWRHHHLTFIHPKKGVKLEIHWRLNPGPAKEPSFDELWERKRISHLSNTPVYMLGREDLFYFLVSHGARHGWSRLRWLVDIQLIVKQSINWPCIIALLKKYQAIHLGGQALCLVTRILEEYPSSEATTLMNDKKAKRLALRAMFYLRQTINLHTLPLTQAISTYHKKYLFSLMSWRQKCLFVLSFLYPYPEDAKTLPLPKQLHYLYFPLRPFIWAWRKTMARGGAL